jgi:hypothetical protein
MFQIRQKPSVIQGSNKLMQKNTTIRLKLVSTSMDGSNKGWDDMISTNRNFDASNVLKLEEFSKREATG